MTYLWVVAGLGRGWAVKITKGVVGGPDHTHRGKRKPITKGKRKKGEPGSLSAIYNSALETLRRVVRRLNGLLGLCKGLNYIQPTNNPETMGFTY